MVRELREGDCRSQIAGWDCESAGRSGLVWSRLRMALLQGLRVRFVS